MPAHCRRFGPTGLMVLGGLSGAAGAAAPAGANTTLGLEPIPAANSALGRSSRSNTLELLLSGPSRTLRTRHQLSREL